MGPVTLGFYLIAFKLSSLPNTLFFDVFQNVLFPAYAMIQNKHNQLKVRYFKVLKLITFISVPISGGMIVFAKPFINIFLGAKWLPAILPMQILIFSTLLDIFSRSGINLFNAQGKPNLSFKITLCKIMLIAISIFPLTIKFGLVGAASSILIGTLFALFIWLFLVHKNLQLNIKDFGFVFLPVCNTLVMVGIIYFISLKASLEKIHIFTAVAIISFAIYFGTILTINKFTGNNYFK